jgi:hypothetical protein
MANDAGREIRRGDRDCSAFFERSRESRPTWDTQTGPFPFLFSFFLFFSLSFLLTFCFCQSREETESQANTVMAKESREGGCGLMAGQRRRKKMTARV